MAKAVLKSAKTKASVTTFVNKQSSQQKKDSKTLIKMMREVTGSKPAMWGESIIGFGDVHLKYASGRELDWFKIGFSPRKNNLSLYVLCESPLVDSLLKQLGPHKRGKGCLYVRALDIIDVTVLEKIIKLASKFKKGGCV
jgi:hypothetical protein